MRSSQQGFTLIELMFVIATIAILATVGVPAYQEYTARAKVVAALDWIARVRHEVALITDTTGSLPPNNVSAGLDPVPTNNFSPYVASVSVSNGKITVAFQNTGNAVVDAGSLELAPDISAGKIRWTCRANDTALYAYVPVNCRNPAGT